MIQVVQGSLKEMQIMYSPRVYFGVFLETIAFRAMAHYNEHFLYRLHVP